MRSFHLLFLCTCTTVFAGSALYPYPIKEESALPSLPPATVIEQESWRSQFNIPSHRSDINFRLPNNTRPESYDVLITTGIAEGNFDFTGLVIIRVNVIEDTSNITLHYRKLRNVQAKLFKTDGSDEEVAIETTYDSVTEFYVIHTNAVDLKAGETVRLRIEYEGTLRDDNAGVFRDSYKNSLGEERWLLGTYFEPHNARHAFPCFDEPALRAVFTFRIVHHESYNAISNMPETSRMINTNPPGTVTTTFEPTPKMSTYLTAFVVSDFKHKPLNGENPRTNRVFSRPELIERTGLTLEFGAKILEAVGAYLGIKYELPKMDQIAIPSVGGGMENWGLVVYGEQSFFYDENDSTYLTKQGIMSLVTHEFAHHWFGNLVAIKWWTYLWMKEGFASYFEKTGVDLLYPEMQMTDLYVLTTTHRILTLDASGDTRPMTHYAEDPKGLSFLFDNIAYGKSGSVIRMFVHAFGELTFKKGLTDYLTKMAYSAAVEEDLFESLQKAVTEDNSLPTDLNVAEIMLSWTRQPGYPILRVTHHANAVIEVRQERYVENINESLNSKPWYIPYNFVTGNDSYSDGTTPDGWLSQPLTNITQTENRKWNADDWVVFNKQQTGFYRIWYDEENHKRIADALLKDNKILPELTRSQLIDDTNNFIVTGRLEYESLFNIVRFLINETEYTPWHPFIAPLKLLDKRLAGTSAYCMFEEFTRDLVTNLFKIVGVDDVPNERNLRKHSRNFAIEWACAKRVPECLDQSSQRLDVLINEEKEFHQNVKYSLLCASMRNATESQYLFIWRRLFESAEPETRNDLLQTLACTHSDSLLRRFIESSIRSTTDLGGDYQTGEILQIVKYTYSSGIQGLIIVLEFLTYNVDMVKTTFSIAELQDIVDGLAEGITSLDLKRKFEVLVESIGSSISSEKPLAIVESNMEWNKKHLQRIENYLHKHFGHSSAYEFGASATIILIAAIVQCLNNLF